ncbi:hypothetical protein SRHO_G00202370 [Serrasalmus rhombeus]
MDRVKSSIQQVPNTIPKVLSRRAGGANSLEVEKENFERSQLPTTLGVLRPPPHPETASENNGPDAHKHIQLPLCTTRTVAWISAAGLMQRMRSCVLLGPVTGSGCEKKALSVTGPGQHCPLQCHGSGQRSLAF